MAEQAFVASERPIVDSCGVAALAGSFGTMAYAVPAFKDFHNPAVPFGTALVDNAVVWAICLGAWGIAVRFVILALRKVPANQA